MIYNYIYYYILLHIIYIVIYCYLLLLLYYYYIIMFYYILLYLIIFYYIILLHIYILQYVIYICEYMIDSLFFWYSIVTFRFSTMSSTQMSNWPLPLQVAWQFHKGYGRREVKPREVLPALQVGPDYC